MAYRETIDDAIAVYLNREKLPRADLAEDLGITADSLRMKRDGTTDWKMSEVVKLSEIIGVPVSELAV